MGMHYKKVLIIIAVMGCTVLFSSCGKASKEYDEAMELIESGKYEESLAYFQSAIQENDERAEYYIAYGMALNGTGRYEEAVEQFEKAYQDSDNKISRQNNKKLYFGQAVSYYEMNDYKKVVEACDKALVIDQYEYMNEQLCKMKATANEFMGNFDKALETYTKLLKYEELASIYLARAGLYEKLGDIEKAVTDYNSAIETDKECYEAYFALYNIYKNDNQNIFPDGKKRADFVISQIVDSKMESAEELLQVGRAYYYMGDYPLATSNLEASLKDGCVETLYYLGEVTMAECNYREAISKFEEYISKAENSNTVSQAYNQIAGCYIMLEDYASAERYIDKGTALGTTATRRILGKNKVTLYEKMAKYKEAKKAAKQYLDEFPNDEDMKKELLFINTRIKTVSLGRVAETARTQ